MLLTLLPANFNYIWFAVLLFIMGLSQGLFTVPNTTSIMNSVPASQRGTASGMNATTTNAASVMSLAVFFSIVTLGLASALPTTLSAGLIHAGLPAAPANAISHLPPIAALFGAFLGYNPMKTLIPGQVLNLLPASSQSLILGKTFFPNLISGPFMVGLQGVFYLSAGLCLLSAVASLFRGKRYVYTEPEQATSLEGLQEEAVFTGGEA